jgi:Putative porin
VNKKITYITCFFVLVCSVVHAQLPVNAIPRNFIPGQRNPQDTSGQQQNQKQLEHRNPLEDSITISYHFFDSTRTHKLDSSINDFNTRYPLPYYYYDLGNLGNAAHSYVFSPYMKAGWDGGFQSYDIYNFTVENTRQFTTSRPYTELGYMLGSKSEQYIDVMHTQNRKSNVNFGFQFRLANAPGSFKNQNTNNSNFRFNISYQGKGKRYGNTLIYISNKIRSSENGGIQDNAKLTGLDFNDPFQVLVKLGNATSFTRNPFSTVINTGTLYDEHTILFRQNYDFGQKDSLVTDSVTFKLFYPRIRFQHTIEYKKENYAFQDLNPDDTLYLKYFNFLPNGNTVSFKDSWEKVTNDVAVISYPQKNNLNQFLKADAGYEWIQGGYYPYKSRYSNVYLAGEYRNRTRNQKWDFVASGRIYTAGDYAGDYEIYGSLERNLNNKTGNLLIGFQNVNRSPSSIYHKGVTSFPVIPDAEFNKENISRAFANISLSKLGLSLVGEYYIIGNYIYFDNYFEARQQSSLFNVLHAGAEKTIKLAKHWNWYIEAHLQKETGSAPVNVPLLFARNRFAFEGNFFRNLFISTGFEVKYASPYHPDNYSPFNGQFFIQDTFRTSVNRPEINAYLNFRIKSFKAFIRAENLNTINAQDKFHFTNYNFVAPYYPQRSFWFRFGVWWSFVN